jgi:hypothetical protein
MRALTPAQLATVASELNIDRHCGTAGILWLVAIATEPCLLCDVNSVPRGSGTVPICDTHHQQAEAAFQQVEPTLRRHLEQSFGANSMSGWLERLPRQQTLEAALDWSYDMLDTREQRALERLAVFAGDWALEAAEAVCEDGAAILTDDVLEFLVALVRKSLVMASEAEDGTQRYRLLDAVRDYARRRLANRGVIEVTAVRERHAAFHSAEVERMYPNMWRYGTVV